MSGEVEVESRQISYPHPHRCAESIRFQNEAVAYSMSEQSSPSHISLSESYILTTQATK